MTARLVVLASGSGSNLQAVLDAVGVVDAAGAVDAVDAVDAVGGDRLDAEVVAVVSNRPDAGALSRVPIGLTQVVMPVAGEARADYDARLAAVVASYQPDWIVLAGWMRILSMAFLGEFPNRVVNLHPALPGTYPGTHAIERAHGDFLAGRITSTGVMVHLVPDEGVDDGPVLATAMIDFQRGEDLDTFTARVHKVEHALLVDTLRRLTTT
jgi:phosphoribosylglycinamide formyltransferase-1